MPADIRVETPNGLGWAFGQLPDGNILVIHGWKDLSTTFRDSYTGHKANMVMLEYTEEVISELKPTGQSKRSIQT